MIKSLLKSLHDAQAVNSLRALIPLGEVDKVQTENLINAVRLLSKLRGVPIRTLVWDIQIDLERGWLIAEIEGLLYREARKYAKRRL